MRSLSLVLALVALLAAPLALAGNAERPVSGMITGVDEVDRFIWVEGVAFHVPSDVYDIEEAEEGLAAVVHYVKTPDGRVAVKLELHSGAH